MTSLKRPLEHQPSPSRLLKLFNWACTYSATIEDFNAIFKPSLNTPAPNKMSFKVDKVGCVFWPGTLYLVQSMEEQVVIAKKAAANSKTVLPLDDSDLDILRSKNIPIKLVNLSAFTGQKGPPDHLVKYNLETLFS
jgi:hypothetical protein